MEIRPIFSALLRSKTGPLLVAIQVALSLAILVNALYVVSLRFAAATRPSGVAAEADVFYARTGTIAKRTHNEILAQRQLDLDVLKALPGIVSVAWTNQMPLSRSGNYSGYALDRKQIKQSAALATYHDTGGLIKTLGLRLLEGRDFTDSDVVAINFETDDDSQNFPKVVIIPKPLADFLFPGGASAIGKTLYYGLGDRAAETQIVGVVERLQTPGATVGASGDYSILVPWRVTGSASRYVMRAELGQRDRVVKEAEAALRKAATMPSLVRMQTLDSDRENRYRNEKALAWNLIAVCALLLLVTASGIVGMTTLRVAQRKKLIGVRRALGARKRDILRYFLIENFLITSAGVVAGVLLAVGLNQLLVSQLEMTKLPVTYLLGGAATLWLLGIVAVYGPAWRAATISPAIATRSA